LRRAAVQNVLAFFARRPNLTVTYGGPDLAATTVAAAIVAAWATAANGAFSPLTLVACEAAFLAFYLVGSLVAGWQALAAGLLFDLPARLLVGYAVVNTALLGLAWLSPLGIVANFAIVFVVGAALFVLTRPVATEGRPSLDGLVGVLTLGLSLAAATLWCQDSIRPTSVDGDSLVFQPWIDGFYHAVHLRIFGDGHGASTIEDFRMSGVPARLYHYGAYLTPAFIERASGLHSYAAFSGILAPLGVAFTGLAAYALVGSFWGKWSGLAAAAALLLLPDGAQQGMQNRFMSYHWLTQISPSASYGLALLALAWLFILLGCAQGRLVQVLAGWLIAAVLAVYKLHFLIASAFLLVVIPPLFYRGHFFRGALAVRRRLLGAALATAAYLVTIRAVQKVPGVPPIRFDGSCVGKIFDLIKEFSPAGPLRDFLDGHLGSEHPARANLFIGAPYVLLAALGLFAPLLVVLIVHLRRRAPRVLVLMPLLIVANFLAMFLGLALDFHSSTPDELSHRPIMLMYFVVVAWVGGAAGLTLLESPRLGRHARPTLLGVVLVLFIVPALLGRGVQRMWAMPMFSPVRVPLGLVRAAEYMRDHGDAHDVFQDSQFDRTEAVAALSERRTYVARTLTIMRHNSDLLDRRIDVVDRLVHLRSARAVASTARAIGLHWFLLEPSSTVEWPDELAGHPMFELDGYRLYRLQP
jgi:hypothetical protein